MFDDYQYKKTNVRIGLRFFQKRDEPMYPWEIASFLNKLNTVYYKYELLNSICSAINEGIDPSDIYILDKSLPLNQRHSSMNVLNEPQAFKLFYSIGLPVPLVPSSDSYDVNFLLQAFSEINRFLKKNHVRPLSIEFVAAAYEVMIESDLPTAESFIVDLAIDRSIFENNRRKSKNKRPILREDIVSSLDKYREKKNSQQIHLRMVENIADEINENIEEDTSKDGKVIKSLILSFFGYFNKNVRPLVFAKIGDGKVRIFGRSLVNKREMTGLELKEVRRNSPLSALFEGGVAIYQAIQQEARAKELHELEIEKKKIEIEKEKEILKHQKLINLDVEIEIQKKLYETTKGTDIYAIDSMQDNPTKKRLVKAYGVEQLNANRVLLAQGLELDRAATKIIDLTA